MDRPVKPGDDSLIVAAAFPSPGFFLGKTWTTKNPDLAARVFR
jgi:hypothetical protein